MKKLLFLIGIFSSLLSFGQGTSGSKVTAGNIGSYAWKLTGNSGTTAGTNFIGTTDNNALKFKVKNVFAGIIDNAKANTFFGYSSGINTSGITNCAFGQNALVNNTGGDNNAAFGGGAGQLNNLGSNNTYLGDSSNSMSTTTLNCTAIGFASFASNFSTAIGQSSLAPLDSTIILGDTTAINGVGIGTSYPVAKLDVHGTLKLKDGTQGAGKVLTSDANGLAAWKNNVTATFGIGTTTPHNTLDVNGMATFRAGTDSMYFYQRANTHTFHIASNDSVALGTDCMTMAPSGVAVFSHAIVGLFTGGDVSGTNSTNLTVTGMGGILAAQFLKQSDTTSSIASKSFVQNLQPYKEYSAAITQASTSAPSATVLLNNTGATITWARTSAGIYTATANTATFTAGKTYVLLNLPTIGLVQYMAVVTSTTVITLTSSLNAVIATVLTSVPTDVLLSANLFDVKIYN